MFGRQYGCQGLFRLLSFGRQGGFQSLFGSFLFGRQGVCQGLFGSLSFGRQGVCQGLFGSLSFGRQYGCQSLFRLPTFGCQGLFGSLAFGRQGLFRSSPLPGEFLAKLLAPPAPQDGLLRGDKTDEQQSGRTDPPSRGDVARDDVGKPRARQGSGRAP